jgi:hypothetical protein
MKKVTIKGLVKKECANFNSDNYTCYPTDKLCKFYTEPVEGDPPTRCIYFEKGVLPLEPELELEYRKCRELGRDEKVIKCPDCKQFFRRRSNRQERCDLCQSIVTRDKTRERVYKMRDL